MKILVVTTEFPPLPGGIGNHALNLSLSLQKEGNEVEVITNQRSAAIDEDYNYDKSLPITVVRIRRQTNPMGTYLNWISTAFKSVRTSKELIVIASGRSSLWLAAALRLFYSGRKYIGILHGSDINTGKRGTKAITKWSLKSFDKLIAVSNFTKSLALKRNEKLEIDVINNGFYFSDIEETQLAKPVAGDPAIVTVGSVTQRKGQQNVIRALPVLKVKFPGIHYHIIGLPAETENAKSLARSLDVLDNVTFHGALSNPEMNRIVSQSKAFFMLSNHMESGSVEGFGIAVLEANHFGVPAIGSINSGVADAIKEGYSGRLVDPHDPNEVMHAFQEIMDNYDHYSMEAKKWSKGFDWNIMVREYIKVIG